MELLGRPPTIFKIGITSDPFHRWATISYGYFREGGESSPPDPPIFAYVVTVIEEEFARWHLARVRALTSSPKKKVPRVALAAREGQDGVGRPMFASHVLGYSR